MKYILLLSICLCLVSCNQGGYTDGVVTVWGIKDNTYIIHGAGVCINSNTILTSAHIVRDDTISYELRMNTYAGAPANAMVIERDNENDTAYMRVKSEEGRVKSICRTHKEYIGKTELKLGDKVYVPVSRSASMIVLSGSITSLTGSVLAYDTLGRTELMTGLLMTDMALLPGDSGSPILDGAGRVVDVVHVSETR